MSKTVRTSISIPADVKARMDAIAEPVNWSAAAVRGIESKLAEIIKRQGARDMKEVIARLRASKHKAEAAIAQRGQAAGREWAMNQAEAEELDRLDRYVKVPSGGLDETFVGDVWPAGVEFVLAIGPDFFTPGTRDDADDRLAADGFWDSIEGAPRPLDLAYVRGFAEGALHVWDQVAGEL